MCKKIQTCKQLGFYNLHIKVQLLGYNKVLVYEDSMVVNCE